MPDNEKFDNNGEQKYILRLFVTGASPNSIRAITNTKSICEKYLNGKYELEIIDVHQQPLIAASEDLIAIPMLMRKFPDPERRGDGLQLSRELDAEHRTLGNKRRAHHRIKLDPLWPASIGRGD